MGERMKSSRDNKGQEQTQYKIISVFSIIMISIGLVGFLSSPEGLAYFIFFAIFGIGMGTGFYGIIGLYNQYSD